MLRFRWLAMKLATAIATCCSPHQGPARAAGPYNPCSNTPPAFCHDAHPEFCPAVHCHRPGRCVCADVASTRPAASTGQPGDIILRCRQPHSTICSQHLYTHHGNRAAGLRVLRPAVQPPLSQPHGHPPAPRAGFRGHYFRHRPGLTTRHVISGVDDILVALWDGRIAEAGIIGSDPSTDLALLQVDMDDLPVATLADDDNLRTGDVVLAIGNAFGDRKSVV